MANGRISKRSVDALRCPPGKDREILWDEDLAGFGVIAFPSGKKSYVLQYRDEGSRSRRVRLDKKKTLTPHEARAEAKVMLGMVSGGFDPIDERKSARAAQTFKEVAVDFTRQHTERKRKEGTAAEYDRLLRVHLLPAFGSRKLADIKRADVARFHASIEAPYAANRAVALISTIWNWAARRDAVSFADNPVRGLEKNPEQGRERFLTSEEFERLGDALRLAETTGLPWKVDESKSTAKHIARPEKRSRKLDVHAIAAVRLLILTGARLREILHAKWENVDTERGIIFLEDSKTGRKPLYLSAPALAILDTLPQISGNPYIIAGMKLEADERGKQVALPRSDLKRPWAALIHAANLPGLRIHDLRHSFASFGAGASLGLPIIGKLLGHSQPQTTARYSHLDSDPLHRAVNTIGATIDAAMNGNKSAAVVPLDRSGGSPERLDGRTRRLRQAGSDADG